MEKLLVQEFLKTHTLAELSTQHGVNARLNGRKFSLNYNMIEAKDSDFLASQCRGLVLYREQPGEFDENVIVGNTTILCRPMNRFFNHGQGSAANINLDTTKFYEKLDGTCCNLYFDVYKNQWHVATRSVSEADLPIDGYGHHTFRSLFEKAVEETTGLYFNERSHEQLIPDIENDCSVGFTFNEWLSREKLNKACTYVFELTTPENQIVVKYNDYKIRLLAIRVNETGEEKEIENGLIFIPICPSYKFSSFEDMVKFVSEQNAIEHEGVVACDDKFNRVKIKNASYLAYNKIRDHALKSPKALLQLCLSGKIDDAYSILPEQVKQLADKMKNGVVDIAHQYEENYLKDFESAKKMTQNGEWDSDKEYQKSLRKALAIIITSKKHNMEYSMMRFTNRVNGFSDFIESHKEANGDYKISLLENILNEIEKC